MVVSIHLPFRVLNIWLLLIQSSPQGASLSMIGFHRPFLHPYLLAQFFFGQVLQPGLVRQLVIRQAAHQLWPQHPPGQSQVQLRLHSCSPVAQGDETLGKS